ELVACAIARVIPDLHGLRRSARALGEEDQWLVRGFEPVVGDRENGRVDLLLVLVEHLLDVAVAGDVGELEDVAARRQRRARHLHGAAEGEDRFLVPLVGARGRREHRGQHRGATDGFEYTHEFASSIRSCLKRCIMCARISWTVRRHEPCARVLLPVSRSEKNARKPFTEALAMSSMDSLADLLQDELKDIYDAEKQLTKALPKLAKKASNEQLREALETHLQETEGHIERLEQIFEQLEMPARGKKCEGMQHLIAEG